MNIGSSFSPQNLFRTAQKAASSIKNKLTKSSSSTDSGKIGNIDFNALNAQYAEAKKQVADMQKVIKQNTTANKFNK